MSQAAFTITGTTPRTITAAPVRADGTPGTIPQPLHWSIDPATGLASIAPAGGASQPSCIVTPAVGANGTATLSVSGVDENGSPISGSAVLTFQQNGNPTVGFNLTMA